jgi:threonine dehydrogenase-like Zn-dependent dehydrogenase
MKAVRIHGPDDLRYEDIDQPKAGKGEIVVRVLKAGVGISDIPYSHGRYPFFEAKEFPIIPGHEFVGEVVEVGSDAKDRFGVDIGDITIAEQVIPDWECSYCKRGLYHLCDHPLKFGFSYDGSWAEYMKYPARSIVHKVPEGVSLEAAATLESTACGIYTVEKGGVGLGDVVLVLGGGFLGMLILQAARLKNPRLLLYCEEDAARLKIAKELGADVTINSKSEDVISVIMELTDNVGCDVVLDHGKAEAIELGSRVLRKRGKFVIGAAYADSSAPKIEFNAICNTKELQFIGRTMSGGFEDRSFQLALNLVKCGRINLDRIITHDISLDDYKRAIDVVERKIEHAIKVVMTP